MLKSEADARKLLSPALAEGLISSNDYNQLSTRLGSLKKWYYFQWHNIGPAFLLSPILFLFYLQTPPRRYIIPPLLFLLSIENISPFFRALPAVGLFDVWDKLDNPSGVLEAIRNLQPGMKGRILNGQVPSEFTAVGSPFSESGSSPSWPLPTPPSPEPALNPPSRWDELRAASKNKVPTSTWDEIRQRDERPRKQDH
ncbi:hypothetical protein GYMLUDRAFT_33222 [Collybiopsis luxurians FD-317 M1]|nr:hypothetical protein GYMLUDRAFT_33222 [Collybiopsis luxurians FD-317 M1]